MIYEELNKFNDIFFVDETHTYTDSLGTKYTSATGWVKRFECVKDWDKIRANKAAKEGIDPVKLKAEWDYKGEYARTLGTACHSVMENLWAKKNFEIDSRIIEKFPEMKADFDGRKANCIQLYNKMKKFYIPIATEFIVNDPENALCGTIDFIAYNKRTNQYAIIDWKTSHEFKTFSSFGNKMQAPFNSLDDCNVNEYSLQLSLYKFILEKYTNIRIGELTLFSLPQRQFTPVSQSCIDVTDKIKTILK